VQLETNKFVVLLLKLVGAFFTPSATRVCKNRSAIRGKTVSNVVALAQCKIVNCPPVIGDLIRLAVGRYNYILYNSSLAVGIYRIA